MKRTVVLFGAGASIEYGAPSTFGLTDTIGRRVAADDYMKITGGDAAYLKIRDTLSGYLSAVNFEQIYHCAHELIYSAPTTGAVDEFRPLMTPFLTDASGIPKSALVALADKMIEVIYSEASRCCATPKVGLSPLVDFIAKLQKDCITRIYSTNYDDFVLQAAPDLYTGFLGRGSQQRFQTEPFWQKENEPSLFHLHGSVHMGFGRPPAAGIGELVWFDDRAEAERYAYFKGSAPSRMDGTQFLLTSVITGLDKLSRLQQSPFSHFYSALARDAMLCDMIFVIGSGLADLHLNTWLHEARSRNPRTPILFVDYWQDGFDPRPFDPDAKLIRLFHSLKIEINEHNRGFSPAPGWTVSDDKTAAIWDKGFQNFLNAPDALQLVLRELR